MSKESGIDTSVAGPSHAATASTDTETDSSTAGSFMRPAEKRARKQAFRKSWLQDPQFESWLQEAADSYKARCAACCINVRAGKSELQRHAQSLKHNTNMNHRTEPLHKNRNFGDSVKVLELKICLEIVEHNRSFYSYDQYTKMLQSGIPNAGVVQHMSLQPTKISGIVKNVLSKAVILEATELLKGKFYSILVDETTDISDTKIVCFLIRYVHGEKIHTYLLDLIGIQECTAANLHKCLLNSLKKYNVPISNIVGLSVDNASVMVGVKN